VDVARILGRGIEILPSLGPNFEDAGILVKGGVWFSDHIQLHLCKIH